MNAGTDDHYMLMALELARKGEGFTSPNPMVGAVLVKDGKVVGSGYHEAAGKAHAEVNAIGSAVNDGENDIRIIVIFSYCSPPVLPCGSCRQKLAEFSKLHNHDIHVVVVNDQGEKNNYLLSSLLPSSDIPVEIDD